MHRSEAEQFDACVLCGEEVDRQDPSVYYVKDTAVLCMRCAARAGGVYDSEREYWTLSPRLGCLAEKVPQAD